MTARAAIILADKFEDSEATSPIEALQAAGVEVTVLGAATGPISGKKGASVEATATIAGADVDSFDLLVIPGGGSPENLRIDDDAVAFTRRFVASGKPVASICHGPQLLISANVLSGRTVTAVNKIRDDIRNAGATYLDEELVVDGNLISSRVPDDLPAFNQALLDALNV
ncbi:type 1 glutamine amidotransferase domain-containing protein [Gephyromycinifex aptenodytis]|uniref:type 1 glutamine amidotransferase domain-containing protein n=1 Tax=Gephyromycinifex aptenodytis TaxID=2716227 RepID=UPI001444E42A|nr:type 1 glutamine amidotransferase domain-containing protein [Gephyromycinifex aptenodytis]